MEVVRQLRQSCYYQQHYHYRLVWIFWFVIALLLYRKSAILGLSFLDPKDLCLPNQFSKAFCQYILNLMSKKKLGSFNDWINAYFQSFICLLPHDMNIFWPASLSKFPWCFWREFSQSWNNLRKKLWRYENFWSLTDLSGASIGFHWNWRDWLFWVFMMSKSIHCIIEQKCAVLVRCVSSILYSF